MTTTKPTDQQVISAMKKYGGGFVSALGNAFMFADSENTKILKIAFPEYWIHYTEMAQQIKESEAE